ncbi:MAG: hypothetical protein ACYDHP_14770, partial [Ferrimicrobium sp.]
SLNSSDHRFQSPLEASDANEYTDLRQSTWQKVLSVARSDVSSGYTTTFDFKILATQGAM